MIIIGAPPVALVEYSLYINSIIDNQQVGNYIKESRADLTLPCNN
jgi:hypothetical protein